MINASVSVSTENLSQLAEPPEPEPTDEPTNDGPSAAPLVEAAISAVSALCSILGICADPNFEQEPDEEDQECE
jgi:hypothetical protein